MNTIGTIRKRDARVLALGIHAPIIQSVLDFDYLCGKTVPSVVAIIAGNRRAQKFFFGPEEILIPCFPSVDAMPDSLKRGTEWALILQSGRRAHETCVSFFEHFPKALGAHLFAENVPEKHATDLIRRYGEKHLILGPSGVGLLVPGSLKLGAIGGTDPEQLSKGALHVPGSVAVASTSGGMTNELIRAVVSEGHRISFAASVGGDRFPVTSLTQLFLLAEADPETRAIVYFGELGGVDEYEIISLIEDKKLTKPVVAYIAGIIDDAFKEHVQFGHAKALVRQEDESARAKRAALRVAGVTVEDTFPEFLDAIRGLPRRAHDDEEADITPLMHRSKSILSTRNLFDPSRIPVFVKGGKAVAPRKGGFAALVLEALMGHPPRSGTTVAFAEAVFELLIDHGGNVSGAVNTMITARAGKDMASALSSGLLTIGPRFGGAVNEAAATWFAGVSKGQNVIELVEEKARRRELIAGIGHRKYRVGLADPRVKALSEFASLLRRHPHYDFARAVEKITTGKNGNLILNVDGAIAALLLDILSECEGYSEKELRTLVDTEFFNAFFIIPRSVGFIGHFLEQKRNDEGLFRLPDELLYVHEEKERKNVSAKSVRKKRPRRP